jgi:predicted TIM-barrel fold metal-dependent hydrolase
MNTDILQSARIIAVEEHVAAADIARRLDPAKVGAAGWPAPGTGPALLGRGEQLAEAGALRLAAMDRAGISVQVLSVGGPGPELTTGDGGIEFARAYNRRLAQIVANHPDRFAALATLPAHQPQAAADELEHAVRDLGMRGAIISGTVEGRFLDDPMFQPLLARLEDLDVPIFLHPGLPPPAVQAAYYGRLPGCSSFILSTYGWGWHCEVAIHVLRLVLSGTLEKHPRLKIIVGHMGEGLPIMMERLDEVFAGETPHLPSKPTDYLRRHLYIATSGFRSPGGFAALLETFGEDHLLFAADYPMTDLDAAVAFFRSRSLDAAAYNKIAHGNASQLLRIACP